MLFVYLNNRLVGSHALRLIKNFLSIYGIGWGGNREVDVGKVG